MIVGRSRIVIKMYMLNLIVGLTELFTFTYEYIYLLGLYRATDYVLLVFIDD